MRRPAVVWVSTLGTLVAFDYWCATNDTVGDSLSEVARATLRTHTLAGGVAFVVGWGALTAWLVPHILRNIDNLAELDDPTGD